MPSLLTLLALICLSSPPPSPAGDDAPPNIVLIVADDLGYGEVGCYGQDKIRTPNIDALAARGVLFTQFYAGSTVCAPSRCVLMTGLHTGHALVRANWENGGWGPDQPEGQLPLPASTITLAKRLKMLGYATGAMGKWGLGGPGTTGAPENQGFDLFYGYLCQRKAHNFYPTHLWRNGEMEPLEGNRWFKAHEKIAAPLETEQEYADRWTGRVYAPDKMIEEAETFIAAHADEPFFLFYPTTIPHAAIQVPDEETDAYPRSWDTQPYLGQKGYVPHPRPRAAYAGMISRLDDEVGRIVQAINDAGVMDNTIILVTSDNGPTWAGGVDHEFFDSNGPLRGLKGSVYEGGIRVPMIVSWPGKIAAGSTSDAVSGFQDLLPTLLEIAGGTPPDAIDGISIVPALTGEGDLVDRPYMYWEYVGKQAVRMGKWKGIRTGLTKGDLSIDLYDLDADLGETTNVADDHPEIIQQIAAIMTAGRTPSEIFPLPSIDIPAKVE